MEDLVSTAFWKNKRVLITGHTGFKGSWLALWLQKLGAIVAGYSLQPHTKPNLFERADVARDMQSHIGDVRDLSNLRNVIHFFAPEIVFHLAAQSLVRQSYSNPVDTYSTNVLGTVNLLESLRLEDCARAIIVVTSDKCYENREWVWGYREDEPMGGSDPYSNSKGCAELVVSAYRASFFNQEDFDQHRTGLASARAGNVIGGGDWAADRLIPDMIRCFENNKAVTIRHPSSIRPWQFVLEPLRGYLLLAEGLWARGPEYAEAWNFGPEAEDAVTVDSMVSEIISLWGSGAAWRAEKGDKFHEAGCLKLDCSKARARLGWRPRLHLKEALPMVVEWYRRNGSGERMRDFTISQLEFYTRHILDGPTLASQEPQQ